MAAQSAAEQFSSSSRNAGPAAATRPGPATVEEVTDSPSGGESARSPWRPHARTALHCTCTRWRVVAVMIQHVSLTSCEDKPYIVSLRTELL